MGMFGLFSPESTSSKSTAITTNTTTTMRDVGLTGQNAVDMAAVMQTGAIETTRIAATSLDKLVQASGKTAQQLIGGASDLVRTQGELAQGGSQFTKLAPFALIAVVVIALTMKRRGR